MEKQFKLHTAIFLVIAGLCLSENALAQIDNMPTGNYLVIGSFHIKSNAEGFTQYVRDMGTYDVKMAFHPVTKFYHVYIKGYSDSERGLGLEDVKQMRRETEFIDTWYMIVTPYEVEKPAEPLAQNELSESTTPVEEDPEDKPVNTEPETDWVKVSTTPTETAPITEMVDSSLINEPGEESGWVKVSSPSTSTPKNAESSLIPESYKVDDKYKFYFNTFYSKNFREVKGPVEIINPKSLKLIRTAQSLELVEIADPNNGSHSVQLIANIFGYKKVQHDINMDEPLDSINQEFCHFKGDTLVADFPLQRYETGDIATMYNVFFFKDAVIMKPISKFELTSLVEMLKENDNLRIKIHGHTNGNTRGKILLLPKGSTDFFTLDQEIKEKTGTAKELSLQRANVIKDYLVAFGIDENRMEVIGWGGKKPIYDKYDLLAIKNVRVEIEILEQ